LFVLLYSLTMSAIRRIVLSLLATIIGLGIVVIFNTLSLQPPPAELEPCHINESDYIALCQSSIERFQRALQFQTVTRGKHHYDREQLNGFIEHIISSKSHICLHWVLSLLSLFAYVHYVVELLQLDFSNSL